MTLICVVSMQLILKRFPHQILGQAIFNRQPPGYFYTAMGRYKLITQDSKVWLFLPLSPTNQAPPAPTANQPNASFGDIMLVPDLQDDTKSRVLIFYGNTREAPGWGQICADRVLFLEKNIADVICRQYGRKGGTFYQLSRWAVYIEVV